MDGLRGIPTYVVSKNHPMSGKKYMTIEDFKDEKLVMFNVVYINGRFKRNSNIFSKMWQHIGEKKTAAGAFFI